jgi:hypothetical protein
MLVSAKPGADFSRECAVRRRGHLLFVTHPHCYSRIDSERHALAALSVRVYAESWIWTFQDAPCTPSGE